MHVYSRILRDKLEVYNRYISNPNSSLTQEFDKEASREISYMLVGIG